MAINLDVHGNTTPLEAEVRAAVNRIRKIPVKLTIDDKGATQPLGNMRRGADEFTKSMEAANARIIAFGASMAIINGVGNAFKALVRDVVEVEKSLADINVVMDLSTEKLDKFSDGLFKVAKETGQAFKVAADAATEYARQGLGVEESLRRTKDALILTRLTGMDSAEAVKSLTAAMNTYGHQIENTTQLVSKFAAVDVKFAVSAEDFADAISRTGSAAKGAGVDIDELIGIVTAAQQKTARGGKVIGNSLKTIFTRVGRTDTLNQLENLGIAVRDIEGNTLGAKKILTDLANTFDTLSEAQKAQIAQTVGGVFQINVLKAILGDAAKQNGILANATQISANATDEAIQKNEMLRGTIAAMASETGTAIKQLSSDIGEIALAPGIEKILSTVKGFAENLSGVLGDGESTGNRFATGLLKGIGNIITGPGLVVLVGVFYKLFGQAFRFTKDSLSSLIGITSEAQKQKAIQTSLVDLMGRNANLNKELLRTDIGRSEKEKIILGYLKAQVAEANVLNNISKQLASTLYTKGYGANLTPVRRGRAHGYVPNFAHPEREEAAKGGYAAGNIRSMHMPGEGSIIYNSAEKVKNFKGMTQPAIMPPKSSKAGKKYQQAFGDIHGFDPYAAGGYIPNFIKPDIKLGDRTDITTRKQAEEAGYSSAAITSRFGKKTVGRGKKTVGRSSDLQKINLNNLFPETSEMGVLLGFGTTDSAGPVEYKQKYSTLSQPAKDALNKRLKLKGQERLAKRLNKKGAHSPLVSATLLTKPVYEVTEGDIKRMEKVLGESILEEKLYKHVGRSFDKFSHEIGVDMFGGKVGKAGVGVLKTHMDGSMLGGMLEAGVRGSLTNKKVSDSQAPFDFIGEDAKNVAEFIGDEKLRYIESKLHKSAAAGSSGKLPMKILNQIKATGYIPNFFGDKIGWKIDKAKGDYSITGSSFKLDGFSRYLKEISEKNPQMVSPQAAKMFEERVKQVSIQADKDRKEASRNNPIGFGRQGAKHYGAMDAVRRRSRSVSTKGLFIKDLGKHVKQYNKHDIFAVDKLGSYDSFLADGYIPNFAAAQLALTGGLVRKNKFGNIDRRQMTRLVRSNPYFNNLMNEYLTWDSFPKKDKRKLSRWLLKQGVSNRALQAYGLASMHGKSIAEGISNIAMAGGYIPNFANPLSDAIGRERAAGVPVSQIRVGSHGALINKDNPLGLGVTNTKDEPNGLRDVFGANGYVPNYAEPITSPLGWIRSTNFYKQMQEGSSSIESHEKLVEEANKTKKELLKREKRLKSLLDRNNKIIQDRNASGLQKLRLEGRSNRLQEALNQTITRRTAAEQQAASRASGGTGLGGGIGRLSGGMRRMFSGNAGMMLMMGAPMAAGFLQGSGPGQTGAGATSYAAGGALQGAASGAMMASMIAPMFGPAAPLVIGIGGLLGGVDGLTRSMSENTNALREKAKEERETFVNQRSANIQQGLSQAVGQIAQQDMSNVFSTKNMENFTSETLARHKPLKKGEIGSGAATVSQAEYQALQRLKRFQESDLFSQFGQHSGGQTSMIDILKPGAISSIDPGGTKTTGDQQISNITEAYAQQMALMQGIKNLPSGTLIQSGEDKISKKEFLEKIASYDFGNKDDLKKFQEDVKNARRIFTDIVDSESERQKAVILQLNFQKAQIVAQQASADAQFKIKEEYIKQSNLLQMQAKLMGSFISDKQKAENKYTDSLNKAAKAYDEGVESAKLSLKTGIMQDILQNADLEQQLKQKLFERKKPGDVSKQDLTNELAKMDDQQLISILREIKTSEKDINEIIENRSLLYDNQIINLERQQSLSVSQAANEKQINLVLAERKEILDDMSKRMENFASNSEFLSEKGALEKRISASRRQGTGYISEREKLQIQRNDMETYDIPELERRGRKQKEAILKGVGVGFNEDEQKQIMALRGENLDIAEVVKEQRKREFKEANKGDRLNSLQGLLGGTNALLSDEAFKNSVGGGKTTRQEMQAELDYLITLDKERVELGEELKEKIDQANRDLKEQNVLNQKNVDAVNEEMLARERMHDRMTGPKAMQHGMQDSFKKMADNADKMRYQIGERIPNLLADGLAQAMQVGLNGAEDIGDAMRQIGINFLQAIQSAFLQHAAHSIVGNMGFNLTKNEGGKIPRYSTGGSVPAMVTDGEYVMSRQAVNKYGGAFMHGLNVRGSAPEKFSQGGLADAFGKLGTYQDSGLGQAFQNLDRGKMNNIYSKMSKAQPRQTIADRMKIIKNDISDFINNDRNMELFQQEYAKAQGQASSMLSNQPVQEIIPKKNWKQKLDAFTRDEKNINLFKQETKSQQKSLQDFFSGPPAQETSIGGQRRSGTVDLANQAVKERNFEKSFQKIPANKITEEKGLKSLIDNNAAKSIKPSPGGSGFIGSLLGGLFSVITAPFKMIGSIFGGLGKYQGGLIPKDIQKFAEGGDVEEEEPKPGTLINESGGRRYYSGKRYTKNKMSGFFYSQSGNVGLQDDVEGMRGQLAKEEAARRAREAKKARKRQFIMGLVGAGLSAGISSLIGGGGGLTAEAKAAGYTSSAPKGTRMGVNSAGQAVSYAPGVDPGNYFSQPIRSYNPFSWSLGGKINKYASGGYISGKSGIDQIPAMLSEGEYVIRASSARKLGRSKLDQINAGRFYDGGSVSSDDETKQETSNSSGNTNNISISVNVTNGSRSGESSESSSTNSEGDNRDQADRQKQMAEKIKEQVVSVIVEEQRPGGLLSKANS